MINACRQASSTGIACSVLWGLCCCCTGHIGDEAPVLSQTRSGDAADGGGASVREVDAASAEPVGDAEGIPAVAANDFLNTLGVNTHVAQGVDAPQGVADAMAYAGLRNFRDDGSAGALNGYLAMHEASGVRAVLLTSKDIPGTLEVAKRLRAEGALLAIEGPNEPNNFPVSYENQTSNNSSFLPVAHFQRDLYAAVKAEPMLAGIPVFHTSEAGGSEPDNVGLQFLTIPDDMNVSMPAGTRYADYANTHNYVCGHQGTLVDNVAWQASDPTLHADWDGLYVEYGHTWGKGFSGYSIDELASLPWVTTETGWLTRGPGSITEEQQGRVLLSLYLAAFKRGVAYTFVYMLRDDPVQGYWGLFDTSYQAKPAGLYLHNLTTIIADCHTRATGRLDYALLEPAPTVHDLLLQKSDGKFALIVWNERFTGGSDDVTVDLRTSRSRVDVYDPLLGTSPLRTESDVSSLTLTLTDHPVVLVL